MGTREALDKRWMVVMTHQKKLCLLTEDPVLLLKHLWVHSSVSAFYEHHRAGEKSEENFPPISSPLVH